MHLTHHTLYITVSLSRFLPSDSREQHSNVGLHGIAARSMRVSPRCLPFTFQFSTFTLLVSVAGTKHFCLTAVNRCGALCCPDFPLPHNGSDRPVCFISFVFPFCFGGRAVYGNRTRLLGLGSRCTTDVLTPQMMYHLVIYHVPFGNRLQRYNKFSICARFWCKKIKYACIILVFVAKDWRLHESATVTSVGPCLLVGRTDVTTNIWNMQGFYAKKIAHIRKSSTFVLK